LEKIIEAIHLKTDEVFECQLNYIQKERWIWEINLDCEDSKFKAQGKDLFEALKKIREELNKKNMDILVNGSRKNVIVSPMMSEAGGTNMYLLRPRLQARPEDIVSTLNSISKEELSTLDEQRIFYTKWLGSLKPSQGEKDEAKKHPNGSVCRIDGDFADEDDIPPEAIIGAWKVDGNGNLGDWKLNPNFIPMDKRD
jgi:hypothetical protein